MALRVVAAMVAGAMAAAATVAAVTRVAVAAATTLPVVVAATMTTGILLCVSVMLPAVPAAPTCMPHVCSQPCRACRGGYGAERGHGDRRSAGPYDRR